MRNLNENEISRINHAISQKTGEDDRSQDEIVRVDYDGDHDKYLRTMAEFLDVSLDPDSLDSEEELGNHSILTIVGMVKNGSDDEDHSNVHVDDGE